MYATDISKSALEVAKKNAKLNGVYDKITFIQSDMFERLENSNLKFDIIISNPPYIETAVIPTLQEEVKREPILALDGGKDGLKFYREIADNAYKYLNENGRLLLEIGYNQKKSVTSILNSINRYKNVKCIKDLSGNDRVITCEV